LASGCFAVESIWSGTISLITGSSSACSSRTEATSCLTSSSCSMSSGSGAQVVKLIPSHEVYNIFDVRNGNGALSNVCGNDHFTTTFHKCSISEGFVLFLCTQSWMKRYEIDMIGPISLVFSSTYYEAKWQEKQR
jgi:hypothetical protein